MGDRTGQPSLSTPPPADRDLPRAVWLYLPVAVAFAVLIAHAVAPLWAWHWLFTEGWGLVELAHFLIPLAAAVIAFRAWRRLPRSADRRLSALLLVLALGCVYIAGEEHSWGQHFFGWDTPDEWGEINRQDETNLHNTTSWLNQKPRVVLNLLVAATTIVVPVMEAMSTGERLIARVRFVLPGRQTRAVGALVIFYMTWDSLAKDGLVPNIAGREAEMHELYLYAFLLIYALGMLRRVDAWQRLHPGGSA